MNKHTKTYKDYRKESKVKHTLFMLNLSIVIAILAVIHLGMMQ